MWGQSSPTEAQARSTGGRPPGPAVCLWSESTCCLDAANSFRDFLCVCRGWGGGGVPRVASWSHAWRCVPVADIIGTGVVGSDNDEDVLKV